MGRKPTPQVVQEPLVSRTQRKDLRRMSSLSVLQPLQRRADTLQNFTT